MLILREQQIQPLLIFLGAQGKSGQCLRLTACKQRRTVYAWQQANFACDFADLVKRASIRTALGIQNFIAENIFL